MINGRTNKRHYLRRSELARMSYARWMAANLSCSTPTKQARYLSPLQQRRCSGAPWFHIYNSVSWWVCYRVSTLVRVLLGNQVPVCATDLDILAVSGQPEGLRKVHRELEH